MFPHPNSRSPHPKGDDTLAKASLMEDER